MKKQMKKAVYEAPVTERFSVELEGSFCGSVEMESSKNESIQVEDQTINTDFNVTFDESNWE